MKGNALKTNSSTTEKNSKFAVFDEISVYLLNVFISLKINLDKLYLL